jgi:hypothetical protein
MKLTLAFAANGAIDGDGVDDIAQFLIAGRFDVATSTACWTKAYVGMHTVEYSGLYCRRAICGDWTLMGHSGGFWIWPESETEWEHAAGEMEIEEPVVTKPGREPDPVRGAICSAFGRFVGVARIENRSLHGRA